MNRCAWNAPQSKGPLPTNPSEPKPEILRGYLAIVAPSVLRSKHSMATRACVFFLLLLRWGMPGNPTRPPRTLMSCALDLSHSDNVSGPCTSARHMQFHTSGIRWQVDLSASSVSPTCLAVTYMSSSHPEQDANHSCVTGLAPP